MAMQNALKKTMFRRNDDLYFLPDMVVDQTKLLNEISRCGCVDLGELFLQYNSSGKAAYLRNENDFKDLEVEQEELLEKAEEFRRAGCTLFK